MNKQQIALKLNKDYNWYHRNIRKGKPLYEEFKDITNEKEFINKYEELELELIRKENYINVFIKTNNDIVIESLSKYFYIKGVFDHPRGFIHYLKTTIFTNNKFVWKRLNKVRVMQQLLKDVEGADYKFITTRKKYKG